MATALRVSQPTPTCSEHELVAAVRRGNDRAFEELYSRYRARISAYIYGMVGDHARAEDISQEVFISALRRLKQTDRPIAFKPWIYEIAKNACIDEFRRSRRAREVPLVESADDGPDEERALISSAPTPDAAVAGKQSLQDLQGAFHGLSENHHKIIVMRELEGLSYGQIGEKLGMTRPVVESTLFRARRKLSEEYQELVSGRRCEQVQALIATEEKESLMKLGIRQRRQLARHLSHCQPCRREARLAELDESLFQAPGIAGKIAALLPIPWLWRRRSGSDQTASVAAGSHSLSSLPGLQTLASVAGLVAPSTGFGRTAAAAAGLAAVGIGGGVVVATNHSSSPPAAIRTHAAPVQSLPGTAAKQKTAKASTKTPRTQSPAGSGAAVLLSHHGRQPAHPASAKTRRASTLGNANGTTATGGSSRDGSTGANPSAPVSTVHRGTTIAGIQVPGASAVSSTVAGVKSGTSGTVNKVLSGVHLPTLPKLPKIGKSAGSQSSGAQPSGGSSQGGGSAGPVSGIVHTVTGVLPKVTPPDPSSALPH